MTDIYVIDPLTAEMTARNIRLTGRFIAEILETPEILDGIPDDATVVLLPPDDPELAQYNSHMMPALADAEVDVHVFMVDQVRPDLSQWYPNHHWTQQFRNLEPHWPATVAPGSGDLQVIYDRERDVLRVDFFGGRRLGIGVPWRTGTALLIDPDANDEIVGYFIGHFLEVAAQRAPQLITTLRMAEFRSLTVEELGGLVPPPAPEAGGNRTEQEKAGSLATEFDQLTA